MCYNRPRGHEHQRGNHEWQGSAGGRAPARRTNNKAQHDRNREAARDERRSLVDIYQSRRCMQVEKAPTKQEHGEREAFASDRATEDCSPDQETDGCSHPL